MNTRPLRLSRFVRSTFLFLAALSSGPMRASEYPRVILRGDYPDPSILREGADYYLTHSPFVYTPGFLIWHSRDLVNWEPVGRAMTKSVGSAMAPDLVKYGGKYYIYFPAAGVNWVIWADSIRGPWSDPIKLDIAQIDPGHVVAEDGQRYLYFNEGYFAPLSPDGLAIIGPKSKAYAGWEYPKEWITECMCLESPKLLRRGGYFYMIAAEGGTAGPPTSHMIVVARAKSARGPWENSPFNPLVHTFSADEHWWSKGHGTLIDDVNGHWWVIYHAYENGHYPLGRQTLIEPIEWTKDGWPRPSQSPPPLPGNGDADAKRGMPLSDDFSGDTLGPQWMSWRDPAGSAVRDGHLTLRAQGSSPADARLLLVTATDHAYEVQVEVTVPPTANAGLVLFYNEKGFAGIVSDGRNFTLHADVGRTTEAPNPFGKHFMVKIRNRQNRCEFLASRDGDTWTSLLRDVDVSEMHHNRLKGFFALRPGLVAIGSGEVTFTHFAYRPLPTP